MKNIGESKIQKVMHEFKEGTLHSGSGSAVKKRDQALAIALSEARRAKNKALSKMKK